MQVVDAARADAAEARAASAALSRELALLRRHAQNERAALEAQVVSVRADTLRLEQELSGALAAAEGARSALAAEVAARRAAEDSEAKAMATAARVVSIWDACSNTLFEPQM